MRISDMIADVCSSDRTRRRSWSWPNLGSPLAEWIGPPPQRGVPTFEVRNPADDSLLALVPDRGPQDEKAAIVAAEAAFMAWARRSAGERATILRRWHDLGLARQADPIGSASSRERGCRYG